MEPIADDRSRSETGGLAGEDEEDRLESVLGIADVPQDAVTNTENYRTMPAHQRRERRLIPAGDKLLQELPVGLAVALESADGSQKLFDPVFVPLVVM
jgi:hypothetical protein